jgi:hypothetical protein
MLRGKMSTLLFWPLFLLGLFFVLDVFCAFFRSCDKMMGALIFKMFFFKQEIQVSIFLKIFTCIEFLKFFPENL